MLRIGPLSNIAALLYSNGDDISPLDGVSLVRKKVDTNVILSEDVANFLRKNLTAQSDASTAPNRSRNFVASKQFASILRYIERLAPFSSDCCNCRRRTVACGHYRHSNRTYFALSLILSTNHVTKIHIIVIYTRQKFYTLCNSICKISSTTSREFELFMYNVLNCF